MSEICSVRRKTATSCPAYYFDPRRCWLRLLLLAGRTPSGDMIRSRPSNHSAP